MKYISFFMNFLVKSVSTIQIHYGEKRPIQPEIYIKLKS